MIEREPSSTERERRLFYLKRFQLRPTQPAGGILLKLSHKSALILRGGGMRSAHGAGFAYALGSILKIQNPDMVIGSSGSAASALCYAAQSEYQCLKRVWMECLSTSKFLSYMRLTRVMDVDYLIDSVFKKEALLAVVALEKSQVPYYISIVDAETGIARFITRQDRVDPFELLRASKALPLLYRKKVWILGREYIDGAIGQLPQNEIDLAVANGSTKIVFVDDSPQRTPFGKLAMFIYALSTSKGLRRRILHDLFTERTYIVPDGVELLYIQRKRMPVSIMGRSKKKLADTFELGVQDALKYQKRLEALLK